MRDRENVYFSVEPKWFARLFGGTMCVVVLSAALVAAVEFTWCPSDAVSDVPRQACRCKTSDLGQESEVARSSPVEAEHC